eukprot:SAG25_NODE_192_length_12211_cov_44.011394_2_plen_226_part_00
MAGARRRLGAPSCLFQQAAKSANQRQNTSKDQNQRRVHHRRQLMTEKDSRRPPPFAPSRPPLVNSPSCSVHACAVGWYDLPTPPRALPVLILPVAVAAGPGAWRLPATGLLGAGADTFSPSRHPTQAPICGKPPCWAGRTRPSRGNIGHWAAMVLLLALGGLLQSRVLQSFTPVDTDCIHWCARAPMPLRCCLPLRAGGRRKAAPSHLLPALPAACCHPKYPSSC